MAESSGRRKNSSSRGSSANIAAIEAPHNPDEEEAYLREAIKASLESEAKRSKEGEKTSEKPKMSAEAADMLLDFMDDFDASGNTLQASSSGGGNEWALAPAPAQPGSQWAMAPAPPAADNSWAVAAVAQPPAPVAQPAPAPTYDQYGGGNAYAAASANPFAPAPVQPVQNYAAPAPPASDPFGAPAFAQAPPPPPVAVASPMAPAYGQPAPAPVAADPFSPQPPAMAPAPVSPTHQAPTPTANGSSAVLTMNSLTSDGLLSGVPIQKEAAGSMADKALQNLMGSIDSFGLSGAAAKPPAAHNPFDSNNIMSNATLGEIKSSKTTGDKAPVMNAAPTPGPGALVMASNQGGNWGSYGGQNTTQYGGMGGGMQQQAPPQYGMSGGYGQQPPMQQQMGYGQQPPMQQPVMGQQPPMQQPMMGQQPPMQQQGYGGAPQYGQQPPMQQNQWGAPSY